MSLPQDTAQYTNCIIRAWVRDGESGSGRSLVHTRCYAENSEAPIFCHPLQFSCRVFLLESFSFWRFLDFSIGSAPDFTGLPQLINGCLFFFERKLVQLAGKPSEIDNRRAQRTVCTLTIVFEEPVLHKILAVTWVWVPGQPTQLEACQDRNLLRRNCSALSISTDCDRLDVISSALFAPWQLKSSRFCF